MESKPVVSLMYAMAKRARELADLKMPELREAAGYGCDSGAEARRLHSGSGRGELIEFILTEEFDEQAESLQQSID